MSESNNKVQNFFQGRNGVDELGLASLELALILLIIDLFARNIVLTILVIALVAYAVFRMFSPDVNARRKESMAFASKLGPVRPWISNPKAAYENARAYKHTTCPNCRQKLRVPRGKGHIRVTCPRCHEKFETRS